MGRIYNLVLRRDHQPADYEVDGSAIAYVILLLTLQCIVLIHARVMRLGHLVGSTPVSVYVQDSALGFQASTYRPHDHGTQPAYDLEVVSGITHMMQPYHAEFWSVVLHIRVYLIRTYAAAHSYIPKPTYIV